jgi:bifunctional ADP-heptose synthase (sugar kinase/adenylyltransferase)
MNIWVNGCFDILHAGHIDLLWYAKLYGTDGLSYHEAINFNTLYVGLDSDTRVKLLKGDKRPINDIETRGKIMSNLRMVDEVYIFHTDEELINLIRHLVIDYMIVGDQYRDKEVIGSENAKYSTIFYPVNEMSTTNIIEKIKNL